MKLTKKIYLGQLQSVQMTVLIVLSGVWGNVSNLSRKTQCIAKLFRYLENIDLGELNWVTSPNQSNQ